MGLKLPYRNSMTQNGAAGKAALLLCGALVLSACEHKDDRTYFNGRYYPAKSKKIGDNFAHFVTTVKNAGQGMDGARQAALQAANRYCIKNFGTSDIIWEASPDREITQADVQGGNFLVQGKCVEW